MPALIDRYIRRELVQYWLAFTLVLWLVLVTARFSLYLGQAAGGELPAAAVLELLALKSVGFFVFLLPLTLFLALLWLFGRLNRDFETLALAASGVGSARLYSAIAPPVLACTLAVAVLSLYLVPESARRGYQLRAQAEQQLQADALSPGRFHALRGGRWLFYAQARGESDGELRDVFIHVQRDETRQVLVASRAAVGEREAGRTRVLELADGHRYIGEPGRADYEVLAFDTYTLRLDAGPVQPTHKWDAVTTRQLWADGGRAASAELQARVARPLSVLVLALLAVPLGRFRPATGRLYPLWLGVLLFTLYFNLLASAQLWLAQALLPAWLGLWWVHLLILVLPGAWMWRSRWRTGGV